MTALVDFLIFVATQAIAFFKAKKASYALKSNKAAHDAIDADPNKWLNDHFSGGVRDDQAGSPQPPVPDSADH